MPRPVFITLCHSLAKSVSVFFYLWCHRSSPLYDDEMTHLLLFLVVLYLSFSFSDFYFFFLHYMFIFLVKYPEMEVYILSSGTRKILLPLFKFFFGFYTDK